MNLTTEKPIVDAWLLPGGNLLVTSIQEGGESTVTLAVTVPGVVDRPGLALVEIVRALSQTKQMLLTAEQGGAAWS